MIYIAALTLSIPAGCALWFACQNRLLLAALFGVMGVVIRAQARKETVSR